MSNIFDDIAIIGTIDPKLGVSFEQADALDSLAQLKAAYNALAPDWTQAPEWAQWCAIDADGGVFWYEGDPAFKHYLGWDYGGNHQYWCSIELPVGIDWRLCKWQRSEVTA